MNVGIHYKNKEIEELYKKAGVMTEGSSGFDLIAAEDYEIKPFSIELIDLGVIIDIPDGYEALLMPRSSTFKKYGVFQANSMGLIDNDYNGKNDFWKFPAFCFSADQLQIKNAFIDVVEFKNGITSNIPKIQIKKGDRICQFILKKKESFNVVPFTPGEESRGGFGSTDKRVNYDKNNYA